MMLRAIRRLRFATIVWAVLSVALPTGVSYADAILASRGSAGEPFAHVEETSGPHCQPVHADDCGLCRFLSDTVGDIGGASVAVLPPVVRAELPASPAPSQATALRSETRTRSPPSV